MMFSCYSKYFSVVCLNLAVGSTALASDSPTVWHDMTVLMNASTVGGRVNVANQIVDDWIVKVNAVLSKKKYDWDVQCDAVRFRRAADVILDSNSPLTGQASAAIEYAKRINRKVNLVVVNSMDCGKVISTDQWRVLGCATYNTNGFVFVDQLNHQGIVVVHERLHNANIKHSADAGKQSDYPSNIANNVMFYQATDTTNGISKRECDALANFYSIVTAEADIGGVEDSDMTPKSASPVVVADSNGTPAVLPTPPQIAGITNDASEKINRTYIEGVGKDFAAQFSKQDIDGIRAALVRFDPNLNWRNAILLLQLNGSPEDVAAIAEFATPREAIVSGTGEFSVEQYRQQTRYANAVALVPDALVNIATDKSLKFDSSTIALDSLAAIAKKAPDDPRVPKYISDSVIENSFQNLASIPGQENRLADVIKQRFQTNNPLKVDPKTFKALIDNGTLKKSLNVMEFKALQPRM